MRSAITASRSSARGLAQDLDVRRRVGHRGELRPERVERPACASWCPASSSRSCDREPARSWSVPTVASTSSIMLLRRSSSAGNAMISAARASRTARRVSLLWASSSSVGRPSRCAWASAMSVTNATPGPAPGSWRARRSASNARLGVGELAVLLAVGRPALGPRVERAERVEVLQGACRGVDEVRRDLGDHARGVACRCRSRR